MFTPKTQKLLKILDNRDDSELQGDKVIDTAFFDCDKPKGMSQKKFVDLLSDAVAEFGSDLFDFKQSEHGAWVWIKLSVFKDLGISLENAGFQQCDLEIAQRQLDLDNERERRSQEEEQARLDALRPSALATQQLLRGVHGEFAEHLTRAFLSADSENQVKLLDEFADVFTQANKFEAA